MRRDGDGEPPSLRRRRAADHDQCDAQRRGRGESVRGSDVDPERDRQGRQGEQRVDADEIAALLGTISYEVTCNVAARVQRMYVDGE